MENPLNTKQLLAWFRRQGRTYPWGIVPTPYRVWISEIMLQQTVITTVIPFFQRWMESYPDVFLLAAASEEEVLRLWEGLGYYTRARNIHKAAQIIVTEYNGELPSKAEELARLPGIGPYTTNAILSIAFGQPRPVMDANILRICQRLLARPRLTTAFKQEIAGLLQEALPLRQPGRFNEALMQLGQLVCRQVPLCTQCPLQAGCLALATEQQETIPAAKVRFITVKQTAVYILRHRERFFVCTGSTALFSGLWRFPGLPVGKMPRQLRQLLATAVAGPRHLQPRDHMYTHYRDQLQPAVYELTELPPALPWEGKWVLLTQLTTLPFPSVYRKIIAELTRLP